MGDFQTAHLATADSIGIELFLFPQGVKQASAFQPFNTGLFHLGVQDPDIEGLGRPAARA